MRRSTMLPWALLVVFVVVGSAAHADGVRIGGRVLVSGGSPLPQADVQLLPLRASLDRVRGVLEASPEPVARALTDDKGRFELLAPRAGLWTVRVEAGGFVPLEARLAPLIEPVELADAQLEADEGLKVKVTDAAGKPRSGATVLARTDRSRFEFGVKPWSMPLRHGVSGDDGTLVLSRGSRERLTVTASMAGVAPAERRGVIGSATTLKLGSGSPQVLQVRSADGEPVPDVLVAVGSRPHPYGFTDEKGTIEVRIDPSSPVEINLLAPDGRSFSKRVEARKPSPGEEKEKPTVLRLPDRVLIAGQLIDSDSRRPVSGGLVWNPEHPADGVITDRSGAFALGGRSGSAARITAGAAGYLRDQGIEFHFKNDGRPGPTLALRPAAAIEGTVMDGDGNPVAGAEVTVEKQHTPGMMRIEIGAPAVAPRNLTDERGKFRIGPVNPEERYAVKAKAEGFAEAKQTVSGLEPYETRSGVEVTLSRGLTVVGRVVDGSERPIQDASITLNEDASRAMGMMRMMEGGPKASFDTATDGDGLFEVTGIPSAKFKLEARHAGFAKTSVEGIDATGEAKRIDLGDVVLEPGERVQGIVTDRDGVPVEGVEVYVEDAGGPQMMVIMGDPAGGPEAEPDGVTDATGWFTVADLAAGQKLNFEFGRTGYVRASAKGIELPRVEPLEISMEPASNVSGRILDSGGEPVVGAEVDLRRRQTIEMGGSVMMTMMMEDTTTDEEGKFLFEDEAPGKISLSAVASGYQEGSLNDLEIPKGVDLEGIELQLPAGAILVGRVYSPDGQASIGARVSKVEEQTGPMRMMGGAPTDGKGYYRLEGLKPGALSIEAMHDDWPRAVKDIELEEGINDLDLYFEGGVEVSGRVVDTAGNPVADAVASLVPAGRRWGGPQTRTDPDGTFEMPGVQDGDYKLRVEAQSYAPFDRKEQLSVAGAPVQGLEVRLDTGATLTGRIDGLDPDEYADVVVRASGTVIGGFDDGGRVDREGNYRLENLLPGDYEVVAELSESGRKARDRVTIDEGATAASVDLLFESGLTLSGRAVQGESPVVGASVYVEGLDRAHTGWGQTDDGGAFSIDGLVAGSYRVNLRDWTSGLAYNETVDIATSREIELKVPTARVSGRIVDSTDRRPISGVTVTLNSDDPSAQGRLPLHVGATDLEGWFEINSVADGSWRLTANKEGYAAESRPVTIQFDKPVDELDVSMDATEGVTFEARLPTGGAPSEVTVAVMDRAGGALFSGTYPTGENGRVRLSTVPPGTWDFVISATGSATTSVEASAPGALVPVALPPATGLRVTVPDLRESGEMAVVKLTDTAGKLFHLLSWNGRPQNEFRMSGGQVEFASLPPGSWKVTVASSDGRSWSGDSVTAPGQTSELLLE